MTCHHCVRWRQEFNDFLRFFFIFACARIASRRPDTGPGPAAFHPLLCRATADRNNAVRESGALRIEKEDLKDRLEEARRKMDDVQSTVLHTIPVLFSCIM